jgi:hypothetical protein
LGDRALADLERLRDRRLGQLLFLASLPKSGAKSCVGQVCRPAYINGSASLLLIVHFANRPRVEGYPTANGNCVAELIGSREEARQYLSRRQQAKRSKMSRTHLADLVKSPFNY